MSHFDHDGFWIFCLLAPSLFPGHKLAQDAKDKALGNIVRSSPNSERISPDAVSEIPGTFFPFSKRASPCFIAMLISFSNRAISSLPYFDVSRDSPEYLFAFLYFLRLEEPEDK